MRLPRQVHQDLCQVLGWQAPSDLELEQGLAAAPLQVVGQEEDHLLEHQQIELLDDVVWPGPIGRSHPLCDLHVLMAGICDTPCMPTR